MTDHHVNFDYGERGSVVVVPDAEALARLAAETLITVVAEATAAGRQANVALSGGSTPKRMGELLASDEFSTRVHWGSLQVFWGDERWVPLSSDQSNAGEAIRTFLEKVPIPSENIHPWETEGDIIPSVAAERYERLIREVTGAEDGVPVLDLIFLGMGDDGHTLSLFPGTAAVHNSDSLTIAHFVPKLDAHRLTFGPIMPVGARSVVFLVGGAGKAETLHQVLDGPIDIASYPSQVIRTLEGHGTLTWLLDEAAAAQLEGARG